VAATVAPGASAASDAPPAASASPAPSTAPSPSRIPLVALVPARREGLLASLRDALAASRATRVSTVIGEASGVLSNNSGGVLSNNGGNVVSDAGGAYRASLPSGAFLRPGDRAYRASLPSGAFLRPGDRAYRASLPSGAFLRPGDRAYRLAQAATPSPGGPTVRVARTAALVYEVTNEADGSGRYQAFDRARYDALPPARRGEALVDEFRWDEGVVGGVEPPDPLRFSLAYTLVKVTSTRIPFADRLETYETLRVDPKPDGDFVLPTGGRADYVPTSYTFTFDFDVTALGGPAERARFEAVAAEADLSTLPTEDGGTLTLPKNMTLTGSNPRGAYEGRIVADDEVRTTIAHVPAAGGRTVLEIVNRPDGTSRETITAEGPGLKLVVETKADRTAAGTVEDVAGAGVYATLVAAADGVATITFLGGEIVRASLF
jgi:hypothetical protein